MNVTRRTALLFNALVVEFYDLGVFDVVGDVVVAIVRTGIDIQKLFGRSRAGKIREQFVRARQPRAHAQITADIRERVLERVSIPDTDLVTTLQTSDSFGRDCVKVGSKKIKVLLVKTMRQHVHLVVARSEEHTSELQSPSFISYSVFCL